LKRAAHGVGVRPRQHVERVTATRQESVEGVKLELDRAVFAWAQFGATDGSAGGSGGARRRRACRRYSLQEYARVNDSRAGPCATLRADTPRVAGDRDQMKAPGKKPCIFCPNPRTHKSGEHVWDDWVNWLDGKAIKDKYQYTQEDSQGNVTRQHLSSKIRATRAVVCDACNQGWMSDLTNETKATAEGMIRDARPVTLLPLGIATIASFTFMKAAVLDTDNKKPYFSSAVCAHFKDTFELPRGVQIWLACYRGPKRFETFVETSNSLLGSSRFAGYRFYVFTYLIGRLLIQLTFPSWTRLSRRRPPLPALVAADYWNQFSIAIYPDTERATWPPLNHLDVDGALAFRNRFSKQDKRSLAAVVPAP
jgi:hypothetical protein